MKRLYYILAVLLLSVACQRESGYQIKGNVPDAKDGLTVYLMKWSEIIDSTLTQNGKFTFTGKLDVPTLYGVWIDFTPEEKELYRKDMRGSQLFVDNSVIHFTCPSVDSLPPRNTYGVTRKWGKVAVTGSPTHDLYVAYKKSLQPYSSKKQKAWDEYLKAYHIPAGEGTFNTRTGLKLAEEMRDMNEEIGRIQWDFIKKHPHSAISMEAAGDLLRHQMLTRKEMNQLLQSLDTTLKKAPAYKDLEASMQQLLPTAKGEKYTDLELTDQAGKTVRLSDYIKAGQYTMVEFWASWCGPCRGEIPHLRHVYEIYGKELNMISVSLDEEDADWKKALKEENMQWPQLADKKGWRGEVATKYHVQGIPFSILLDPDGKIIAREVRGSDLDILLIHYLGDRFTE